MDMDETRYIPAFHFSSSGIERIGRIGKYTKGRTIGNNLCIDTLLDLHGWPDTTAQQEGSGHSYFFGKTVYINQ